MALAGILSAIFKLDTRDANKAAAALTKTFKRGALQAVGFGTAIGSVALAVGKLASTVGSGIRGFVDFEKSMLRIETLVGVSRQEVEGMKDSVRGIAAATGRGPQELAEAMFQITSAGLRGNDALIALKASAEGAALGLGQTSAVADAATSIVNAYGVGNVNAAQAVDVLIKTVQLGKASADQFATSIGRVIPTASTAGISIQEVGTAMAILTRSGASASEATTQLAGIIRTIIKPTVEAEKALATAGLTINDVRDSIAEKGLLRTLEELRQELGKDEYVKFAGRQEAVNAALSLTGPKFEEVSKAAQDMATAFGMAQDGMKRLQEDASYRAERMGAVWQNTKDAIGGVFTNIMLGALDTAKGLKEYADWLELSGQAQNVALAGLIRLIAGLEGESKAIDTTVESVSELAKDTEHFNKTLNRLNSEAERREKERLERVKKQHDAFIKLEKSREAALREFVKQQQDYAVAAYEAAQAQAELNAALEEFPVEKFLISDVPFASGVGDINDAFGDMGETIMSTVIPGIGDIEYATKNAEARQKEYDDALARAADLARIIPGEVGQIAAQTLAAVQAVKQLEGGFGGIAGKFKSGDILGGLSGALGIAGPLIGLGTSLVKGIAHLFKGGPDLIRDAARDLGATIDKDMADSIEKSGKPIQLSIADIFRAGGFPSIDQFAQEIGDIFALIGSGAFSAADAIPALQDSVSELLPHLDELGARGQEQIQRIINAAQDMGIQFEGLDQLIQSTFAPDTVETMAEKFGLTNDQVRQIADTLGIDVQTNLERVAASVGLTADEFTALGNALETQLNIPADQLAEFLESSGLSAQELADKLGVDVGEGAKMAADAQEKANERLERGVELAKQLENALRGAAAASGGIRVPGGGQVPGAAAGDIVTRPSLRTVGEGGGAEVIAPVRALLDAAMRVAAQGDPELRKMIRDLPDTIERAVVGGLQRSLI